MANIVVFDVTTKQVKQFLKSVNTPDYSSRPDVVVNPDVASLSAIPIKYWVEDSGAIREMDTAEKDAIDAAEQAVLDAAEAARVTAFDDSLNLASENDAVLAKVDIKINAISSLADAKVFLKKLARWLLNNRGSL